MEEGREKVTAEGDVTRIVVSGSRTSEVEAELLSADVDDRRVTKDAAAVSECTRKATEASTKNEAERKYSPVGEEVSRDQESKGTEGTTSIGGIMRPRWKESLSCVNILKKLGKSRVPRESTHRRRKEEKWNVWNPQRRRITCQNRQGSKRVTTKRSRS